MKLRHGFIAAMLGVCAVSFAQTPWSPVQARNYPVVKGLDLVRHEQSILLGESDQQTGLFFAQMNKANSNEVQAELVQDAQRKGWKLQTALRLGTYYVTTFSKGQRLLDVRLVNSSEGVEAVYSVALTQQSEAPIATAAPSAAVAAPVGPGTPMKLR